MKEGEHNYLLVAYKSNLKVIYEKAGPAPIGGLQNFEGFDSKF
jgi:hypothetical protein